MTAGSLRLFVAAEAPAALREAAARLRERWQSAIPGSRWSKPDGIHLTLKFLGATEEGRVGAIEAAVGECARTEAAFALRSGPPGLFGGPRRPRVLWVGLEGDTARAVAVAGRLDAALAALGFPREDREFRPHLTLARFDPSLRMELPQELIDSAHASLRGHDMPVGALVLFHSRLGPGGSQYQPIRTFALASGAQ
jgi:2'-5' RNA ligase